MDVATFSGVLNQIQILDVRPELQYNAAHIPGKQGLERMIDLWRVLV